MTRKKFPTKYDYVKWVMDTPLLRNILLRGLHETCRQLVTGHKSGGCYPFVDDFQVGKEYTALNLAGISQKGSRTVKEDQLNVYLKTGFAGCMFNNYVAELGHDHTLIDRQEYQEELSDFIRREHVGDAIEYAEEHELYQTDKA